MKKINPIVLQKILLQAEEAEFRDMKKLASAVTDGLQSSSSETEESDCFSESELKDNVYNGLWKLAFEVIGYHYLDSVDIEKIDKVIIYASNKFVREVEQVLDVEGKIGPNEPKLIGQK